MKKIISKELGAITKKFISLNINNGISYELSYKERIFYHKNFGIKKHNDFNYMSNNKFYYRDTFRNKFVLNNVPFKQFSNKKVETNFKGISLKGDFNKLIMESSIIVDKTLFIKEIIEDKSEVILLTMPRRFGKSLNLNMLQRFLSVEVDNKGNEIINSQNKNHKLFVGGEIDVNNSKKYIKKSELIANNPDLLDKQGTFPVIFLDFKDCIGENEQIIKEKLRKLFLKTIIPFGYLGESKKQIEYIDIGQEYNKLKKNLESFYQEDAIKELSSLLYHYHNKNVWILIDEYDSCANYAYLNFDEIESKKITDLFRFFFSVTFKGNLFLDKGIITGIHYLLKSGMLSGLNNITKHNYNSIKYSKYYGINENEMIQLLNHFNIDTDKRLQIKNWYNGYKSNIGTSEKPVLIDKYNTWSVVNYLNYQPQGFVSYWEESNSAYSFLQNLIKNIIFYDKLNDLINDKSIDIIKPIEDFKLNDFLMLKEIQNNAKHVRFDQYVLNLSLSYLLVTGYLTKNELGHLQLPNKDLKSIMKNYLAEYCETIFTIPTNKIEKITTFLDYVFYIEVKEISNIFESKFGPELSDIINELDILDKSDFDNSKIGQFGNENLIHVITGFIALQISQSQYTSEKYVTTTEGKNGRVDIYSSKNGRGMIIELKFNNRNNNDIEKVNEALNQAKSYKKLIEKEDTKIFVGCSFNINKEVFLSGEIITKDNKSILFSYSKKLNR